MQVSPKHPHYYIKSSQALGAVGSEKSTQRLWLKSKFLFECTKVSSRKMDITNDRRGEKKAKHTFGMHLRKETEPVKLSDVRSAGCSPAAVPPL